MTELTTKTALVTGASRGIGRAVAGRLASEGALVGVHYGTNDDAARETLAAIEAAGGEAFLLKADLGLDDAIDRLFDDLDTALDGKALDVLVNNAGVLDPTPFDQATPTAFDQSYAVNVRAPFFITQRAVARMRNGGRIINLSSAVTRIASPFTHYAMNKAAIEVFGRTLANALGPRQITVNTVTPGVVDTDMGAWLDAAPGIRPAVISTIAMGRVGLPADVADVVAFLASDAARWITGASIEVSGGQWLGPLAS